MLEMALLFDNGDGTVDSSSLLLRELLVNNKFTLHPIHPGWP